MDSHPPTSQQPNLEHLRDAALILGGLLFCERCMHEACPEAPIYTNEAYAALAEKLDREGWVCNDDLTVYCPNCDKIL